MLHGAFAALPASCHTSSRTDRWPEKDRERERTEQDLGFLRCRWFGSSWCTAHIPPWYEPYTVVMRGVLLRCGGKAAHVPRAYANQSIHAQTIIPLMFQEHTLTRASMPKPAAGSRHGGYAGGFAEVRWEGRSCSKSIR